MPSAATVSPNNKYFSSLNSHHTLISNMENCRPVTAEAPACAVLTAEEAEDLDEPPERRIHHPVPEKFQRTAIRRPNDNSSLLTKAFMGQSDDDVHHDAAQSILSNSRRRRSMTSNISLASTADLTSDTGLTSPSRTNTPSPPIPEMAALRLGNAPAENVTISVTRPEEPPKEAPRKRCIQFACAAKPQEQAKVETRPPLRNKTPSALEAPRRPCIKFMCPARPASTQNTPPRQMQENPSRPSASNKSESPSTPRKQSYISSPSRTSPRPSTARRLSNKPGVARPRFLRANSKDLVKDGSQFHEFASGLPREDDWVRQEHSATANKLTIYDTLTKENHIRQLAAEAEEEAELEEAEDEEAGLDEDDEELDDELDGDDEEDEEDEDGEESDEGDGRDGYSTDEETGFAESDDDEEEEDENMILWTPSNAGTVRQELDIPRLRRASADEQHSDSSAATSTRGSTGRVKARRIKPTADALDLPDSTDFVCGTLDEDRPLEEAYMSCLAARRNEKLRVIPQDIDPSFPASDPDNDDEQETYNPIHHGSDEHVWMQGEMEDLHHEKDRSRRRKKVDHAHGSPRKLRSPAPKRHHSPPPKRHHSPPPPKARGRSPKLLFDRHSPRRVRSSAPKAMATPTGSPHHGAKVHFNLAGRPGPTQTKSLPRPAAFFPTMKQRKTKAQQEDDMHVRSAIDIVKGLEEKRQRRKEKFHQKYCNRARRGQIPERKAQPGRGAERMRELGLLMAGKKETGNYMLSI